MKLQEIGSENDNLKLRFEKVAPTSDFTSSDLKIEHLPVKTGSYVKSGPAIFAKIPTMKRPMNFDLVLLECPVPNMDLKI